MTPDEQDLARRLAAHPRWRWMRGMCALTAGHPVDEFRVAYPEALREASELATCIPDLADPATQGCLWAMLMETGRIVYASWAAHEGELTITWIESPRDHQHIGHADLRPMAYGEALARALLDAWGEA